MDQNTSAPAEPEATADSLTARPRLSPSQGHLIIGIAAVVIAAFLLVVGRHYSLGTLERPGPGLFPLIALVGLGATGLLVVVTSALGKGDDTAEPSDFDGNLRVLKMTLTMIVFVIGAKFIGFTVTAIVCTFALVHFFRAKLGLLGRAVFSIALVAVVESVFTLVFGINFPGGLIGVIFE